jgi:predicted DNA-binding transcriptional regulator YafY
VIDRFGKDVAVTPSDDEHFVVLVNVAVSPQFLAWVAGFGNEARVLSPDGVIERLRRLAKDIASMYES